MERVTLFEDIFEVTTLNPDGYKFDHVNRLQGTSSTYDCELLLDINCDIYKVKEADKISLVLTTTLRLDGSRNDHLSYEPHSTEPSLADSYDYVMHGKIFNIMWCGAKNWDDDEDVELDKKCRRNCRCDGNTHKKYERMVVISISFGGLLMQLVAPDARHLAALCDAPDQRLYLLMKKD